MRFIHRNTDASAVRKPQVPEVFFQLAGNTGLYLQTQSDYPRIIAFLDGRIIRQPQELRSHVQRIFLLIAMADRARLFGALVDLYIALGAAGEALKQRCLSRAEPLLDAQKLTFLECNLRSGLRACDPALARVAHAVLSLGCCGSTELIHKNHAAAHGYEGAYEEALDCLEYGQLNEARRVLEEAVLAAGDDARVTRLLLEIYQRAKDPGAIASMRERLIKRHGTLPAGWLVPVKMQAQ